MRKIRLIHITNPDLSSHYIKQKMFCIALGNKQSKWFSNEKEAKTYLANVNRILNDILHELNYMYGEVFRDYRQNWGYFDETRKNEEKEILKITQIIDRSFILAVNNCQLTNGNHFTFKHLTDIIEGIERIINLITDLLTERKHYAEVHRLDVFLKMTAIQKLELSQAGSQDIDFENE